MTFEWLAQVTPQRRSPSRMTASELRAAMRQLWTDHTTWTRNVIISFAAGLPDLQVAEQRLLRNQDDIGNAIRAFSGDQAANQLTALLKQHILQAVDVLKAAKSGDKTALEAANRAWQQNGDQIADLLATATGSEVGGMRRMMRRHLDTTLAEAAARIKGDWAADVAAYDAVYDHILIMSDVLSSRIARQFHLGGAA